MFSSHFLLPILARNNEYASVLQCNKISEPYGLQLSPKQAQALVQQRRQILATSGRVELNSKLTEKMITAFCNSPFIQQHNYLETLTQLFEIFYYFKNELENLASDDELISFMQISFNGCCQGSLNLLCNRELERFSRRLKGLEVPLSIEEQNTLENEEVFDE